MQMREDLQLQTAIRALCEVVLPAVDAGNALAVEQLQVVIGTLQFMAARLPLRFNYDRDELARLLELCRALDTGERSALAAATAAGTDTLAGARTSPAELLAAIRSLRELSGAEITARYRDGSETERARVTQLVLDHAAQQLLRERAWVAPQGWEIQPEALPAIEELLWSPPCL
jgi:hypothetical protein